ncbi:ETC complex I subunit conserved region-domain-containing protein [Fimicolochytrium jonesii]|uniref:ETC complex I subunit conserved region-domain-containing protein n=1 Tax=Fimicolochytrium jonesii TaxID=1396493 RepID=UPI0022FE8DD0|nr:ETC complex I subunit conserved region-domain-containing protein [Fimicolochytrium jonesii]KAI8820807.1 ETC complex I subunit conserved region-domain-containing protein [Fimicolochytrium jonesii]
MESLSGDKTADKDAELIIPNPKGGNIIFEADAASGVPDYVTRRPIRIYQRSRSATQQGSSKAEKWVISFDVQERWENPLMGWASSHDPVQGVTMEFPDREQAIRFALRQGWEYTVDEPAKAKFRIKTYADNFKYVPGKLRFIKTK